MTTIGRDYRAWVLKQHIDGYVTSKIDDMHLVLLGDETSAAINFYPYEQAEICELCINRTVDDEPIFFLHFLLDDLARAEELFGQMVEALLEEGQNRTTHILLSCTSALTTTMFASKLNEVAQALSLPYDFTAMSVDRAMKADSRFAAIMLAPQAAYMRQKLAASHPNALVFEIPGKVFGSYDAPAALRLLMHAMREMDVAREEAPQLRAVRELNDARRVLIITLFALNNSSRLGYRLYDHGEALFEGAARKPKLDLRDIRDLIETLVTRGEMKPADLDAIGIAVPGVTRRGVVTLPDFLEGNFDLGWSLADHFGVPVYVDNNCNAAAVGCYVSQDEVESLVFYRHAFGHIAGGLGTVIDGRLLKGYGNLAGEPKFYDALFNYPGGYDNARWSVDGMHQIAHYISLTALSLIAPEALYLAVDTVDDAEEFRAGLARVLGEDYTPPVHLVNDYVERVYLGELALALQKLRDPNYRSLGVGRWVRP